MADPRGLFFVIVERDKRPWLGEGTPLYTSIDAELLPAKPEREHSFSLRGLAIRLRSAVRPGRKTQGALR